MMSSSNVVSNEQRQILQKQGQKVFVAMSGGVDSSVAAALLKRGGFDVTGVHMVCWDGCDSKQDRKDAFLAALRLNIPFLTFDFRKEYREKVFEYMVKEYAEGRTPNPDVMCNKKIKFGLFLEKALEMGADYVATGHYVRLSTNSESNTNKRINESRIRKFVNSQQIRYSLMTAKDKNKDQSYFLWTLNQEQLKHCLFPAGDYLKSGVRKLARTFKLPNAEKKDSQGLCFVGKIEFNDFLKKFIAPKQGKVLASDGKQIGEHDGAIFYTIGQRRGIGVQGRDFPYYIAGKDLKTNTLFAAGKNDPAFYKKEVLVREVHWIAEEFGRRISNYGRPTSVNLECQARIRYRQPLQDCAIYDNKKGTLKVLFKKPVWAPAAGQSVVFYKNNQMLGGGIIS